MRSLRSKNPSPNKAAHSGFETERRRQQNPQKGHVSTNEVSKNVSRIAMVQRTKKLIETTFDVNHFYIG